MKKTILSLLVAAGLIGSASAAVFTGDLNNGLVAYYGFNGNFADSSGNNNNLVTPSNGFVFGNDRFGNMNRSLVFTQQTLQLDSQNNSGILGNQDRTFSAWIKSPIQGINTLLSIGFIEEGNIGTAGQACVFYYRNDTRLLTMDGSFGAIDGSWSDQLSSTEWHNVIWSYSGSISNSKFYFDGISLPTTQVGWASVVVDSLNTQPNPISIGHLTDWQMQAGTSVSDVGIWNTALTSSQVSELYTLQSAPEPSTYALFGIGAIGMLMVMRRKKSA